MRITTDRDRCTSSGMCVLTAPDVFDQDDLDGRVVLLITDPDHRYQEPAAAAAALCPAQAIDVEDAE